MANYKMVIEDNAGNGYLPAPGLPVKTSTQWTVENRVLLAGEVVQESDTGLIKIGDGVKNYTSLPYFDISEAQITKDIPQSADNFFTSAYRKLPGGFVLYYYYGILNTDGNGNFDKVFTLPVLPPHIDSIMIRGHLYSSATQWDNSMLMLHCIKYNTPTQIRCVALGLGKNAPYECHWFAICR